LNEWAANITWNFNELVYPATTAYIQKSVALGAGRVDRFIVLSVPGRMADTYSVKAKLRPVE
jgi:hypothetical protein